MLYFPKSRREICFFYRYMHCFFSRRISFIFKVLGIVGHLLNRPSRHYCKSWIFILDIVFITWSITAKLHAMIEETLNIVSPRKFSRMAAAWSTMCINWTSVQKTSSSMIDDVCYQDKHPKSQRHAASVTFMFCPGPLRLVRVAIEQIPTSWYWAQKRDKLRL